MKLAKCRQGVLCAAGALWLILPLSQFSIGSEDDAKSPNTPTPVLHIHSGNIHFLIELCANDDV